MLKVKVLGFGCHRCQLVEQIAAEELVKVLKDTPDLIVTLEHVDDVLEI